MLVAFELHLNFSQPIQIDHHVPLQLGSCESWQCATLNQLMGPDTKACTVAEPGFIRREVILEFVWLLERSIKVLPA